MRIAAVFQCLKFFFLILPEVLCFFYKKEGEEDVKTQTTTIWKYFRVTACAMHAIQRSSLKCCILQLLL